MPEIMPVQKRLDKPIPLLYSVRTLNKEVVMETKHKPATPLPWYLPQPVALQSMSAVPVHGGTGRPCAKVSIYKPRNDRLDEQEQASPESLTRATADAAYIAHAANAYPKLVEALHNVVRDCHTRSQQARDTMEVARLLLLELGEAS
jgi:hypothetical protein